MPSLSKLSQLYNKVREKIATEDGQMEADPEVKCAFCSSKSELYDFNKLARGQHITLAGEKFSFNIKNRLVSIYTHHALVKSCQIINARTANVTLIHYFTTPYDATIRLRETTEHLDLNYHEIHVVTYRHPTHGSDEIIRRAESIVSKSKDSAVKYSFLSLNCEHFCNWCCVGNETSYQVENASDTLRDILSSIGVSAGKVLKVVCKLVSYSIDDVAMLSQSAQTALVAVPWGVLGVIAIVSICYTINRHFQLSNELKHGRICSSCCRRGKQDNWLRCISVCVVQAGGLGLLSILMAAAVSNGIVIGFLVVTSVLTVAITSLIPRLRRLFLSPFQGKLVKVRYTKNIWIGDVISFDHWKLTHDGVVSSVEVINSKEAKVSVIHYSLPKLFGTRTIVEDKIKVNLRKDHVVGHDYSGYETYPPEIVVERARKRLGEQKFGILSNRTCHFCHWAKVKEDNITDDVGCSEEGAKIIYLRSLRPFDSLTQLNCINVDHSRRRNQASQSLGSTFVKIRDELTEGQIVSFKNGLFWHKAISTTVVFDKSCDSKLLLTVIHYGQRKTVCEETFQFDLRYEDIWIDLIHPVNRFKKEDIVRRARSRIGEQKYNLLYNRSSHLARDVALKQQQQMLTDLDDLKRGDAIRFYYWSLLHDGIVVFVQKFDSKSNNIGRITVIHYALDNLFGTRTVKKDRFHFNLINDTVYLLDFTGYITYPPEKVVQRAKSRVGEQRFNPSGNTSSDLVHWSKVVQTPAIIAVGSTSAFTDEQLVLPKVGKAYKNFQIVKAQAWCDLKEGDIVEYNYYWIPHQAILSEIDEKEGQIKVIHYGARHLFAPRTIMEDTMKLNLKYDTLTIYRADPKKANSRKRVLSMARSRLGEQNWKAGNRSWDFCLSCVLKPETKET